MSFPIHLLNIKLKNGVYQIKVQFSYCKNNGTPYVLAIVNYAVKKENGKLKLFNWLNFSKQSWNHTSVGVVDFYYLPYHKFNLKKLDQFIDELCKKVGVPYKPFEYYLADDYDEIQKLKGIDYYIGMGGVSQPSGKSTKNCGKKQLIFV